MQFFVFLAKKVDKRKKVCYYNAVSKTFEFSPYLACKGKVKVQKEV